MFHLCQHETPPCNFSSLYVDHLVLLWKTSHTNSSMLLDGYDRGWSWSTHFAGECIVEVQSNNGILTPIEKAVPIAKVLCNAPPPPITATKLIRGHLWLANVSAATSASVPCFMDSLFQPSGDEGGNCVFPLDGHKYMCEKSAGRSGLKNSVFQARRGRQFFAYTYSKCFW